jgi:hypothetical protein
MLLVSRDDVDKETLTEFPVSTRFIKLPVANYLRLLKIEDTMNKPQIALINALNNPKYRFICAALARRLGKTYIANVVGQMVTLIPDCHVLIMSPNYSLSSISFELQRRLIKNFDLEVTKDNLKDKVIELSNGSTVRMGSVGTVDSVLGRSYNLIIFDEAAISEHGESAFNIQLRPTLDRPNSKAIFISTPRGRNNWFSKFWDRGFSTEPEYAQWCSLQATWEENTRMNPEDVASARGSMSKDEFEQEYNASFNTFQGQIYTFNAETNTREYVYEERATYIGGLDPGFKDPTAFAVIAHHPISDTYWVVDEYQAKGEVTSIHAAAIAELVAKWDIDPIFIDSAAAQFAADLAYEYDIATIKAKKDKLPGIGKLQTIIEQGRLFVAPHCTHTLAALDQYKWKLEGVTKETPVHDDFSHMADALRYPIYTYTT